MTENLSQIEINDLIELNKKLSEENKLYKNQIILLKDKINEQLIIIQDNKLKYDQDNRSLKEKLEKEIHFLKEKIDGHNEEIILKENNYKIKINEIEKENSLLYNSKQNMEKDICELKNKILLINEENESQIKLLNDSKKDIINNYEQQITELKNNFHKLKLGQIETEDKLKTQTQLVELEKISKEELKIKLENEIKELCEKIDILKNKSENDLKNNKEQLEQKEIIIQKLFSHQKEIVNESDIKIKEKTEEINQKAKQIEKMYSQERQKNEFLQEQNKDLLSQITQLKKNQNQILEMLNMQNEGANNQLILNLLGNNISKESINADETRIKNIKNIISPEILLKEKEDKPDNKNFDKNIENYEINRKSISSNIIDLSSEKKIEELESKLKEYKKELDSTQDIRINFNAELKKQAKNIINDYEQQLILKEETHRNEIRDLNTQSEDTLNQLRAIFTEEKQRLENKIISQKKKFDENLNFITKEYDDKLIEQDQQNKLELDNLQLAYDELEAKYNTLMIDAEHQILLLNEKLMTADNILSEDKNNLVKITNEHNKVLEKKLIEFNKERKELNEKIDILNIEKTKLNQEISKKIEIINKLNNNIKDKDNELNDSKKEYDTAIDRIINKFETYKQKQQDVINEYSIKKLEYQREINLLKQQIDFLNNKIQEQQTYNEENNQSHEENILELKQELEENFSNRIKEIIVEKKQLNDRIKDYESQIIEMKKMYEEKYMEEKNTHKKTVSKLEDQLKNIICETDFLKKKSVEPVQKINELLEKLSILQKQNHEYKDNIQKLVKENKEQYKNLLMLEKEKNELIKENENINNSLFEIDSKLKSKIPKTADFKQRFKNMGQSSLNMVRHSIDNINRINIKNNRKIKEMPKKPSSIYGRINSNLSINSNENKIKNASHMNTDFRKK